MENIKVSASVVTYNCGDTAAATVASILARCRELPLDFYIIDNNSSDDTLIRLKEYKELNILKLNKNIGFGAAHNAVLDLIKSDYHFIVNPDITVGSDVFADMVRFMQENPDVVMATPKIMNTDKTEQHLPKSVPTFKRLFTGRLSRKVRDEYVWANREITAPCPIDFCTGCFFCIRTQALISLGGFDERFFMYLEDADLTMRAKSIGKVVFLPDVEVTHLWNRASAKSVKLFAVHLISCFKFLLKWRHNIK